MLPNKITKFENIEKEQFWLCNKPNTLCRIVVCVRSSANKDVSVVFERYSKPFDQLHAELSALRFVADNVYTYLKHVSIDNSTVLDVIIRINNSPCSECQDLLIGLLLVIKSMLAGAHFRFILFFSNFYEKCELGVRNFCNWMQILVANDIIVIVCPLFVDTMVPKPFKADEMILPNYLGQNCIDDFRQILFCIDSQKYPFPVFTSHEFFRKSYPVDRSLFGWENPHFISLCPNGAPHHLSKLQIESEFFE